MKETPRTTADDILTSLTLFDCHCNSSTLTTKVYKYEYTPPRYLSQEVNHHRISYASHIVIDLEVQSDVPLMEFDTVGPQ